MGMARTVAVVFGAIYLIAGLAGFVLESPLFGLFAVNTLHNIVHIVIGAILLYGSMSTVAAIQTTRGIGALLVVLGILGFVEPFPDLVPLGGSDIFLHLATGAILVATGFMSVTADVQTA